MSITTKRILLPAALILLSTPGWADDPAKPFGFGTTPTFDELAHFSSPLPDGRGLPEGSGSVTEGKVVYQEQCQSCHGQNLEGGIGDRLIGGRGTLVNDDAATKPVKTVESYWPYATTLFDYIKRSMPFIAPDSLSNDQVYAVTAYILSEAKIVPADATLDAKTLAEVQMPNRDGFIPDPRPDTFPSVADSPHQERKMLASPK